MESEKVQDLSVAALLGQFQESIEGLKVLEVARAEVWSRYEDLKAEAYRRMMS